MRSALIQLCSGDDPEQNLPETLRFIGEAVAGGAEFVLTPECSNALRPERGRHDDVFCSEAQDKTLAALRRAAKNAQIWLLIGSLSLRDDHLGDDHLGEAHHGGQSDRVGGRLVNRSFLIAPDGAIVARYDKIHMFDAQVSAHESYRESASYRPGTRAVLARTPFANIGMSICYDVRFAHLYRRLALGGAHILTVPAAFTQPTGAAHWHVLLRARAIETGCFVLAPAQCGTHKTRLGTPRKTYGHSLAISPWGEILAQGEDAPGVIFAQLDLDCVTAARARIPSMTHDVEFYGP